MNSKLKLFIGAVSLTFFFYSSSALADNQSANQLINDIIDGGVTITDSDGGSTTVGRGEDGSATVTQTDSSEQGASTTGETSTTEEASSGGEESTAEPTTVTESGDRLYVHGHPNEDDHHPGTRTTTTFPNGTVQIRTELENGTVEVTNRFPEGGWESDTTFADGSRYRRVSHEEPHYRFRSMRWNADGDKIDDRVVERDDSDFNQVTFGDNVGAVFGNLFDVGPKGFDTREIGFESTQVEEQSHYGH